MKNSQIWRPTPTTHFRLSGLHAMHGGPRAMHLPEHAHLETQVQVRFRPVPGREVREAASCTLYAPQQSHQGGWEENWEVVVLLLRPDLIAQAADELFMGDRFEIRPFANSRSPFIEQLSDAVRREFHSPDKFSSFHVESLGHAAAGYLLRNHADKEPSRLARGQFSTGELRRIDIFIDEQMDQGLRVLELAAAVHLGPQRFSERFRTTTGMSPWRYVQTRRLARARRLLADPKLPLVEIALRLGYSSQSHFTNAFRQATGVTPKVYRHSL